METWEQELLEPIARAKTGSRSIGLNLEPMITGGGRSSALEARTMPQGSSGASVGVALAVAGVSFLDRLAGKTTPSTAQGLPFVDHVIVAGNDLNLS